MPDAPKSIAPFVFEGLEVRRSPSGDMAAVDVLTALRVKSPRSAWRDIKRQYGEEFCASIRTFKFHKQGRPTEVISPASARKIGMVVKGEFGAKWRDFLNTLYEFVEKGGEEVANYGIDSEDDPAALRRIELRSRSKRTNKNVNRAITQADANCYSQMADMRNVAVCGRTAKELKRLWGVSQTRDGMSDAELTLIAACEELEASAIKLRNARGNGEVLNVGVDVTSDVKVLRNRYIGPLNIPAGDGEATPLLQVEI